MEELLRTETRRPLRKGLGDDVDDIGGDTSSNPVSTDAEPDAASILSDVAALEELLQQMTAQLASMRDRYNKKLSGEDRALSRPLGERISACENLIDLKKMQMRSAGIDPSRRIEKRVDATEKARAVAAARERLDSLYTLRKHVISGSKRAAKIERKQLAADIDELERTIERVTGRLA